MVVAPVALVFVCENAMPFANVARPELLIFKTSVPVLELLWLLIRSLGVPLDSALCPLIKKP